MNVNIMTIQYIAIKEASRILGVSPLTLRNWDKNGKLKALRHPMNNYRVYRIEDLEKIMQEIEIGSGLKKREFKKVIVQHLTDEQ
jgi:MerR family transcriptional regulator, copper efflux regulator